MRDVYFDQPSQPDTNSALRDVLSLAYVNRYKVIITACILANIVLAIGWFWPKSFTSYSTIIFEDKAIIQPLLQGSGVVTDISARADTARELMFSRTILARVAAVGGWLDESSSLLERERRNEIMRQRIVVRPIGANLIRIEFKDEDPEKALRVADFLSETFVDKSHEMQIGESNSAFEFIDAQVEQYREKLTTAEQALMEYNSANLDSQPGSEITVGMKISELEIQIEESQVRLAEVTRTRDALIEQLDSEGEYAESLDRERRLQALRAEANKRLGTLRMQYHDSYPDIVQTLDQLNEIESAIQREQLSRGDSTSTIDDIFYDPKTGQTVSLVQQLRRDLAVANTEYSSLQARIQELRRQSRSERSRGVRINESAVKLSELTREYEVNKGIHQDLLRRRENARVSLSLDQNKQGLSIRVYEKAFLPLKPSGLRFLHFAIFGVLLAVVVPISFLYLVNASSKRLRSSARIERLFDVPVVAQIPHMENPGEIRVQRMQKIAMISFFTFAIAIYLGLGILRYVGFGFLHSFNLF